MKTKITNRITAALAGAICGALCVAGCDIENSTHYEPPPPVSKKIVAKECPVEQRMGFDVFADQPLRQKTVTIHYLVAEDGSVAEVGISDYATTQIGANYSITAWTRK